MTTIVIYKNNDQYIGFECFGHSGYGEYGSDIVCASISTIAQSTALGIVDILKLKASVSSDDKKGKFKLILNCNLDKNTLEKVNVLFDTMKASVINLESQFPKNIKLEEKTYVY